MKSRQENGQVFRFSSFDTKSQVRRKLNLLVMVLAHHFFNRGIHEETCNVKDDIWSSILHDQILVEVVASLDIPTCTFSSRQMKLFCVHKHRNYT